MNSYFTRAEQGEKSWILGTDKKWNEMNIIRFYLYCFVTRNHTVIVIRIGICRIWVFFSVFFSSFTSSINENGTLLVHCMHVLVCTDFEFSEFYNSFSLFFHFIFFSFIFVYFPLFQKDNGTAIKCLVKMCKCVLF